MPDSDAMPIDTPSIVSAVRSLAWPRFVSASLMASSSSCAPTPK